MACNRHSHASCACFLGAASEQLTKIIGAIPLSARLSRAPFGRPPMDWVVQTHCGKLRGRRRVASILPRGIASLSGSG
jgi:hypothetical protein